MLIRIDRYFIDRNPELFPIILDYLRTGKVTISFLLGVINSFQVNLKKYTYDVFDDLQTELEFYKIAIPEEIIGYPCH